MRPRPLLLDLFCCEGGAATGYHRAGFDVIGVDIDGDRLDHYPFESVRGDWRDGLAMAIATRNIAAIHASPPCQLYSASTAMHDRSGYPDLVGPTRAALVATGLPWVIENVEGAPLVQPGQMTFDGRSSTLLCGSMFQMERLRRHRIFETNWPLTQPGPCRHETQRDVMSIVGHSEQGSSGRRGEHWGLAARRQVMEMPWASRDGVSEAIPPAYTEYIGRQLIQQLAEAAA